VLPLWRDNNSDSRVKGLLHNRLLSVGLSMSSNSRGSTTRGRNGQRIPRAVGPGVFPEAGFFPSSTSFFGFSIPFHFGNNGKRWNSGAARTGSANALGCWGNGGSPDMSSEAVAVRSGLNQHFSRWRRHSCLPGEEHASGRQECLPHRTRSSPCGERCGLNVVRFLGVGTGRGVIGVSEV